MTATLQIKYSCCGPNLKATLHKQVPPPGSHLSMNSSLHLGCYTPGCLSAPNFTTVPLIHLPMICTWLQPIPTAFHTTWSSWRNNNTKKGLPTFIPPTSKLKQRGLSQTICPSALHTHSWNGTSQQSPFTPLHRQSLLEGSLTLYIYIYKKYS